MDVQKQMNTRRSAAIQAIEVASLRHEIADMQRTVSALRDAIAPLICRGSHWFGRQHGLQPLPYGHDVIANPGPTCRCASCQALYSSGEREDADRPAD